MKKLFNLKNINLSYQKLNADELKSKVDETKLLINDILKPGIANEVKFDINSKLQKIDELLTVISKSNTQENVDVVKNGIS